MRSDVRQTARGAGVRLCAATLAVVCAGVLPANADRIENQVAVFSALDKVTAQIKTFKVALGKSEVFGALKVTPRACYSRPATEQPKTTTFVEVDEIQLDGQEKRVFTGWMFAESPGLHGVEHPTYDVWLNECEQPANATAAAAPATKKASAGAAPARDDALAPDAAVEPEAPVEPRRRVRR